MTRPSVRRESTSALISISASLSPPCPSPLQLSPTPSALSPGHKQLFPSPISWEQVAAVESLEVVVLRRAGAPRRALVVERVRKRRDCEIGEEEEGQEGRRIEAQKCEEQELFGRGRRQVSRGDKRSGRRTAYLREMKRWHSSDPGCEMARDEASSTLGRRDAAAADAAGRISEIAADHLLWEKRA